MVAGRDYRRKADRRQCLVIPHHACQEGCQHEELIYIGNPRWELRTNHPDAAKAEEARYRQAWRPQLTILFKDSKRSNG